MPNFIKNTASLYNGVSQQSVELRLDSQVAQAINAKMTVPKGLEKRPPAELILSEDTFYTNNSSVYAIDRDDAEQYLVVFGATGSTATEKVYDLEGNTLPIVYEDPAAESYFKTPNAQGVFSPDEHLKFTSVIDTTIVANTNVVTAMDSETSPALQNFAYVWVKDGRNQVNRSVTINSDIFEYTAPAVDPENVPATSTETIVDFFVTSIDADPLYSATKLSKSVFRVSRLDGAEVAVSTSDSYGDTTMTASNSTGTEEEDLPPIATQGDVVTIETEIASNTVYYLEWSGVVWREAPGPGGQHKFNASTLPHALIRRQDDGLGTHTGTPNQLYFSAERLDTDENLEWLPRETGDDDTSPLPSFIGTTIKDVFFFKSRLGFLAGESVILSATDDFFNLFPLTVTESLDDDPIDITISSNRSLELLHASIFPESLIVLGRNLQFSMSSGQKPFTNENITIEPSTSYDVGRVAKPVPIGASLYFHSPLDEFSSLREYAVQPDTLVQEAADVTGHVPEYLPKDLKQLIPDSNLEYVFAIDRTDTASQNSLWVYKFFWQGNEKIQSSWSSWDFHFKPIGGWTFDGVLYLLGTEVLEGEYSSVLFKLNLANVAPIELDDDGVQFGNSRPLLDRLSTISTDPITSTSPCILTFEVTQAQYDMHKLAGVSLRLVDKVTGEEYTYLDAFESEGLLYLSFLKALCPQDLGELEGYTLGSYTLGSYDIELGGVIALP